MREREREREREILFACVCAIKCRGQVAGFFLVQHTTTYQNGKKHTKRPQNIPNCRRIFQMAIKYMYVCLQTFSITRPSKTYPNCVCVRGGVDEYTLWLSFRSTETLPSVLTSGFVWRKVSFDAFAGSAYRQESG
jgi:hypothetical protein